MPTPSPYRAILRSRHWIALLILFLVRSPVALTGAEPGDQSERAAPLQRAGTLGQRFVVKGIVRAVHAPRLFSIEDRSAADRVFLVLMPRAEATPLTGTTVAAQGVLQQFNLTDHEQMEGWSDIDERTRNSFAGGAVIIATSVITATGGQLVRTAAGAPRIVMAQQPRAAPSTGLRRDTTNSVRPSALANLIDELAGQAVNVRNARVVGVFNPQAFLIESVTPTLAMLGTRDRVLVLVAGAGLRVAPASLVASSVLVAGVARTLLGVQVTAEVPWPAELTREAIDRLEIRAAVLATSVQTADGVELTNRPSPPPTAAPAPAVRPLRVGVDKDSARPADHVGQRSGIVP
jgi:hypothetical protein